MADFIIEIVENPPATAGDRWTQKKFALINEAIDAYISNEGRNLVANDDRLILDCEAWESTENVELGPTYSSRYFTTDSTRYVWIRSKSANRWDGTEGSSFVMAPISGACINYCTTAVGSINYLRIDGIEFSGDNGADDGVVIRGGSISSYNYPVIVQYCVSHDLRFGIFVGGRGYYLSYPDGGNYAYIGCCLGYAIDSYFIYNNNNTDTYVMNCTGFSCVNPISGDCVINGGGNPISLKFHMMNTYGRRMDNPVDLVFRASYAHTHTNYNANSSASAILYVPGSAGGSNQCVANVLTYKNSDGADQDGTLSNFALGTTDTNLKGAGYNLDALGGVYEDCVENGAGEKVDILGSVWPPSGSPTLWDVGAFTTYISVWTVTTTAGAHGAVTPNGAVSVNDGDNKSFDIFPGIGYEIDEILLDSAPQIVANPFTVVNVTADMTLDVTFKLQTLTVTASAGANGSVAPSGATPVTYGDGYQLDITPDTGYEIDEILLDGAPQTVANPYIVPSVEANHTVVVSFKLQTKYVTISSGANGTTTPTGVQPVLYGSNLSVTMLPSTGYETNSILVDSVSRPVANPYIVLNVTADTTFYADFKLQTKIVTASAGAGGSITPTGAVPVTYGQTQQFTATFDPGYATQSILWNSVAQTVANPYTTPAVTGDSTLEYSFYQPGVDCTVTSSGNVSVQPFGTVHVAYGGGLLLVIKPNSGYRVKAIYVNDQAYPLVFPFRLGDITEIKTIYVEAAPGRSYVVG